MATHISPLTQGATAAWDRFVEAHPDGTFFHRAAWAKIIEKSFGHDTAYVFTERDGAITGVLPLAQVKTLLFGNTLISVPFCVYGGPLAVDLETEAVLYAFAEKLLKKSSATAVEFRFRGMKETTSDWLTRPDLYVTFRKQIESDHDKNLKAIPRKQRAMVRKGTQNGLRSVVQRDVGQLHGIYAESVRNLGTPVFSHHYFAMLAEVFGSDCDVLTVLDGDEPIASVMNFWFRDEVLPYYGGGRSIARQRAANDFMYWEVMRTAVERGCHLFDFGRSKLGTGAFDFKTNWGFVPEPLNYRYKLSPGASIPDHNPLNPKYRLFIAGWKRLPLAVANVIGPSIVRGLG